MSIELLVAILAGLGSGVGAYAAVRYDLGRLHEVATQARESASAAHKRIDTLHGLKG